MDSKYTQTKRKNRKQLIKTYLNFKKISMILILIIISTSFSSASLLTDLKNYYSFTECTGTTAYDNLSSINGTITGATYNATGKIGCGLSFGNTTQQYYVTIGNTSNYDFIQNTGVFTIGFWWYKDSNTTAQFLFDNTGGATANKGITISFTGVSPYYISTKIFKGGATLVDVDSQSGYVINNALNFIVISGNGTHVDTIINGNERTNSSASQGLMSLPFSTGYSSYNMLIGLSNGAVKFPLSNTLDEIFIYNRSLNITEIREIQSLHNSGISFPLGVTPSIDYTPQFINQTPSDININNVVTYFMNITYNISIPSVTNVNISINNGDNYVNGSLISGYFNKTSSGNNGNGLYFFNLSDNEVLSGVYNYDESTMENTAHEEITFSGNNMYLVNLYGINTSKQYNIFEAYLSTSGNSRVYYCNNNYTSGKPDNSANCVLFATTSASTYNHTHKNSKHNIFSMPIINGAIGNVNVSSNSKFIITSFSGSATIGKINVTPRIDTTKFSSNNGNAWSNSNFLIDLHVHQFSINDSLCYYVNSANSTNTTSSAVRCDSFDAEKILLNPTSFNVSTDKTGYYHVDNVYVNRTNSNGYNSTIVKYDYSLVDASFNYNNSIINNTNISSVNFSVSGLIKNSYYYVKVIATDSNGLTSTGYSDIFYVYPVITTLNVTDYNYEYAILSTNISDLKGLTNPTLTFWGKKNNESSYVNLYSATINSVGIYVYNNSGLDYNTSYSYYSLLLFSDASGNNGGYYNYTTNTRNNPTISLIGYDNLGNNYANLIGSVDSLGDYTSVIAYFEYLNNSVWFNTSNVTINSVSLVNYNLTNLISSINYSFKFSIKYLYGVLSTSNVSFTTGVNPVLISFDNNIEDVNQNMRENKTYTLMISDYFTNVNNYCLSIIDANETICLGNNYSGVNLDVTLYNDRIVYDSNIPHAYYYSINASDIYSNIALSNVFVMNFENRNVYSLLEISIDKDNPLNIILISLLLVGGILTGLYISTMIGGTLVFVSGILLLFNTQNVLISLIIIIVGVLFLTRD